MITNMNAQVLLLVFYCTCVSFVFTADKDTRIIIVGAGMAGISAGKTLYEAGYKNFTILEATNRIGGRIHSAQMGDYKVELGAMWIYGADPNPIHILAKQQNMTSIQEFLDDWTVYEDGDDITDAADEVYERLDEVLGNYGDFLANEAANLSESDFTVRAAFRHLNWEINTPVDELIEGYFYDYEFGTGPEAQSGKYYNPDLIEAAFDNDALLIVSDKRGFIAVTEPVLDAFDSCDRITLNKPVVGISQSLKNDVVEVTAKDGEKYLADYVIVSVPHGVLQRRQITLSPPLSAKKQFAIDQFISVDFTHIFIQFSKTFWDPTMYILHSTKTRGRLNTWLNMNHIFNNSNILMVSLWDDTARWAEYSSPESVLQEISATLQQLYPDAGNVRKLIKDYKISNWGLNPYARGAWSAWPPGFTKEDMALLGEKSGRVYFAGEYTDPDHFGFVHGAYMSGVDTANDLITCLQNGPCT